MLSRGREYTQEFISKSSLNSSPSKQMFSFTKEQRFKKQPNLVYVN